MVIEKKIYFSKIFLFMHLYVKLFASFNFQFFLTLNFFFYIYSQLKFL